MTTSVMPTAKRRPVSPSIYNPISINILLANVRGMQARYLRNSNRANLIELKRACADLETGLADHRSDIGYLQYSLESQCMDLLRSCHLIIDEERNREEFLSRSVAIGGVLAGAIVPPLVLLIVGNLPILSEFRPAILSGIFIAAPLGAFVVAAYMGAANASGGRSHD